MSSFDHFIFNKSFEWIFDLSSKIAEVSIHMLGYFVLCDLITQSGRCWSLRFLFEHEILLCMHVVKLSFLPMDNHALLLILIDVLHRYLALSILVLFEQFLFSISSESSCYWLYLVFLHWRVSSDVFFFLLFLFWFRLVEFFILFFCILVFLIWTFFILITVFFLACVY